MKSSKFLIIGVLAVILLWGGCSYNSMVRKGENIPSLWANVESEYQRRSDLIPNIVASVSKYAEYEKDVLTAVTNARASATGIKLDASNMTDEQIAKFEQAQSQLSGSLSRLLVAVEKYPDLKANEGFNDLRAELAGTENRIKVARNNFNAGVQDYNTYIKTFPRNLFAGMFGFQPKVYFKSQAGTENAPNVKQLFDSK